LVCANHVFRRLEAHNAGRVSHTADGKPWIIDVIVEFSDERRAVALEKQWTQSTRSSVIDVGVHCFHADS
jgi:hypothetical protein